MSIDLPSVLLLLAAGFSSGLFISICGGTAAGYVIPILTLFLGKTIHKSIGTSLSIDSVVSLTAGLIFLANGKTKLRPIAFTIIPCVSGAFLGSFLTSSAPESGLNLYVGFVLVIFGLNLSYNGVQKNIEFVKSKYSFDFFRKYKNIIFVVAGFGIGLTSGFTGFGGSGFIALGLIFILDYDLHTAIGSSLLIMFFLAGFGSIGHIINGNFLYDAALIVGFAAVLGAIIGSCFANRIDENKLGRIIGIIMLILGIAVFVRLFFGI